MRVGLLLTGVINDVKTVEHLQRQLEYWNRCGLETEIYSTTWSNTHRYPWSTPTLQTDYANPVQDPVVVERALEIVKPIRHRELLYSNMYELFVEYCGQFSSAPYDKINRVAKGLRNQTIDQFENTVEFDDWWITYAWFTRFVYYINQAYSLSQVLGMAVGQKNPPGVFLKWRWDLLCNYQQDTASLIYRLGEIKQHEGYGIHFNRAWLFGEKQTDVAVNATRLNETWPLQDQPVCVDDTWFAFNRITAENLRKITSAYLRVWSFDEPHQHRNLWSAVADLNLARGSYTAKPLSRILVRSGELIDDHFHRDTDRFFAQQQQNNQLASQFNTMITKPNATELELCRYQAISSFDWSRK